MAAETTPPFSDTQMPWGGHPSCGRPADYLPSGTVGQWHPVTGQWWNELQGGDPKTDQVTQGADSKLPGWQPKEKAAQLPQKGGTLETAWVASVKKKGGAPKTPEYEGEGTQEPWRRGATGFCRLSRQLLVPIPQRPQQELEELRLEEGEPPREAAVEPEPERQEELCVDPSAKKDKRLKSENTKSESPARTPRRHTATQTLRRRHLQVKKASEPCKRPVSRGRARELVLSLPLSVFGFGLVLRVVVGPCFLGGFSCRSFGVFPRGFFLVFAFFFLFFPLFSLSEVNRAGLMD